MLRGMAGLILPQSLAQTVCWCHIWLLLPPTCSLRSSFLSSCASRREGNLHFLVRQEMTS